MTERHRAWRRDLNALVRDPDQRVSEAKLWANIGKALICYVLLFPNATLLEHWEGFAIMLLFLIAPDLVKKMLTLKYGGPATGNGNGNGHGGGHAVPAAPTQQPL